MPVISFIFQIGRKRRKRRVKGESGQRETRKKCWDLDDDSRRQDGGVHGWRYQEAAGGRAEGLGKEGGMDTQDGRLRGRWRREGQKDRATGA